MQMMMPQLHGGSFMAQQNNSEAQFANGPNPDFTSSLGLNREAPEFNPPAGPSFMQQMPPGVMPMPMPHMRQAPSALSANNFNLMGAPPGAFTAGPNGSRLSSMALVGPQAQLPQPLLGVSNANSLFNPLPSNANHMFPPGALAQMPPQLSQQHVSKQLQAHSQQFPQLPLASAFGSGGGPYSSPSSRHLPPTMRNNSNELLAHGGGSELAHLAQMPSQLPMHLAAMGLPPNNAMPAPQMGLSMGAPQMANHQNVNAFSSMLPPMDGPMAPPFSLPPGAASGALFPGQAPLGINMAQLSGAPLKGMVGQSGHLMPGAQFVPNQLTPPGFAHHTLQQHPPYLPPFH